MADTDHRDLNQQGTLMAVSSVDLISPVLLVADPVTHELLVNDGSASSLTVTDGVTTVTSVTEIDFTSGATVTNGGGGIANVAISGSGTGTVTSVSVVSANGFAGTVATATTTPAITISTSINAPVLAGNGTAIAGATTTGTGSTVVLATSPTLVTPALGVATATSLAIGGATIGSNGLAVTGHLLLEGVTSTGATGTGALVFGTAPTITLASASTAVTQSAGDNTTAVATDAFVTTAIANAVAGNNPVASVSAATTLASNTSAWTYVHVAGIGDTFTGPTNTAITIDGFTFTATTQSLLIKNDTQTAGSTVTAGTFNGVYGLTALQTVGTGAIFTRRLDYDTPADINNSGVVPVINGTANASTTWLQTNIIAAVGTGTGNNLSYTQFSYSPTAIIPPSLGGTGIANNAANTLTYSGNFGITETLTATTSVTFPTSGTLVSSVTTGNGVSATNTAGALAFTLGAITPSTVNGNTFTTGTYTLTGTAGKTLTFNNSITLAGTDSTTMTFPATSATVAGLGTTQTFTGQDKFNNFIDVNNAVTVTSNAGTVPVTFRLNTFTNSSAATMAITLATASAVDGQMTIVRIYDFSAAAETIGWTNTENSTVSVPTTSNGSTTLPLTVGFMYNTQTSKWRCIASA